MSELVYLFVDGETNSAQEEILFNTLAGNPELQQELQEAILIRSTLEQDCSALAVPPDTTAAIFQKAGFALPGAAASGVSSVTSLVGKALYSLKSLALPALFSLGGAAIATMYFISHSTASENTNPLPLVSNIAVASVVIPSSASDLNKETGFRNNESYSAQRSVIKEKIGSSTSKNGIEKSVLHPPQSEETISAPYNFKAKIPSEYPDELANSQYSNSSTPTVRIQNSPIKSTVLDTRQNQSSTDLQNGIDAPNVSNFENKSSETDLPISASLRGLISLTTFPSVGKTSYNNEFNNIALSVAYRLNKNISIGIEGGRQSLHYYTFENGKNENATLHASMDWAGAFYKQQFPDLTFSDITPYTQVTLGGTLSGPSGRLLTGFMWQPDSRISLSAGIEGSAFLYQKSADWYSLRALGFMYQVEVKF